MTKKATKYSCKNLNREGQATVEFALLLPVLCLLLVGAIQLGMILQQYIAVTSLTRETARYSAVNGGKSDAQLTSYMQSITPPSLKVANLSVSFSPTPASSRFTGNPLSVGIRYNLAGKLFIPPNFFGWQVPSTLPAYTVTIRVEQL